MILYGSFFTLGGIMEEKNILDRIERTEKILKNGTGDNIMTYLGVLDMLRKDYEQVKKIEKSKKTAKKMNKQIYMLEILMTH